MTLPGSSLCAMRRGLALCAFLRALCMPTFCLLACLRLAWRPVLLALSLRHLHSYI